MVDTSLYQKDIPSRTYRRRDEEDGGAIVIRLPPPRAKFYGRTVYFGLINNKLDAKRVRREISAEEANAAAANVGIEKGQQSAWAQVGYVVIIGIIIALIGTTLRFVFSGPVPFAVAAIGMLFVIMALWQGSKLQRPQLS
jgi:hypothetical protein